MRLASLLFAQVDVGHGSGVDANWNGRNFEVTERPPHKHKPTWFGDDDGDGDIDDISAGQIVLPLPSLPKTSLGGPRSIFKPPKLELLSEKVRNKNTTARIEVYDFGGERALRKTSILAMNPAKWLQTATDGYIHY